MRPRAQGPYPIPVLMYHDVADSLAGVPAGHRPYVVLAARFVEQMRALAALGMAGTSLETRIGPGRTPGAAHGDSCVLTFDDGHVSNLTRALPLLAEHGFRATFFVTTGWIGRSGYMSWDQVRALAAAGMEIGSHSVSHRPPATLGAADLLAEMRDSKRAIEDRLGRPIRSASSPTGFFNPALIPAAREAGYEALCCGRIALWRDPGEAFAIPRIPIKVGTTSREFSRIARGDGRLIAVLRGRQIARDALKRALGVERYGDVRRVLLGWLGRRR